KKLVSGTLSARASASRLSREAETLPFSIFDSMPADRPAWWASSAAVMSWRLRSCLICTPMAAAIGSGSATRGAVEPVARAGPRPPASRGPGRVAAAVRFLEVAMAHIGTRAGGEKPAARSERWEAHALAEMPKAEVSAALRRQHFLYFLPLPQGHGSLRPIPRNGLIAGMSSGSSGSVGMLRTRSRSLLRFCEKLYQPD